MSSRYGIKLCEAKAFTNLRLKALITAHKEERYKIIHHNIVGIVFLGTPHRGSKSEDYGHILQRVATTVPGGPTPGVPNALKRRSGYFRQMNRAFKAQSMIYNIISVYESNQTEFPGELVSPL